ncbi:MAG: acetylglutamate kinase [Erysipelotrichaceae bacterium]|nr:acetylglutamate kinase [Erysipelotrichaceae bacterium]
MKYDDLTNSTRAHILVQALPYIQRYYGKTVVVKYGGNAMTSEELKEQVMEDIVLLTMVGVRVVLVHGGGPELSHLMQRLGKKPEFIDGLRVTDKETIDMAQMVLAGKINKSLVNLLQMKGGQAVGLSGMDGRLIEAVIRDPKYGYVGDVTKINADIINTLLDSGYIPVISTLGCDREGNTYNINGDTGAGKIASAIKAERLIMMTDIEGIMKDRDDPDSLISSLSIKEAEELMEQRVISGGMIPKVTCCTDALNEGVKAAVIIDGRVPHAVLMEILTDEGAGTMITKE